MTTFTAPFSIQIPTYNVAQPASFPHHTTIYSMDINGNVINTGLTGQIVTVLAGQIVPSTAAEHSTGYNLPANAILSDVFLNVLTAETVGATKTTEVGILSSETGGNAAGFLNGISVAATGLVRGVATVTTGVNTHFYASTDRGVFFTNFFAGSDVVGHEGLNYETPFLTSSVVGKTISYTPASVFSTCVADIYVTYIALTM
jgi:hypothetical protein